MFNSQNLTSRIATFITVFCSFLGRSTICFPSSFSSVFVERFPPLALWYRNCKRQRFINFDLRGLAFLRIFSAYLCFGNELKHFLNICNVFTFYFIVGSRFPRPIQSSQQKFIFQPMVSNCKQSSLAESVQKSLQKSRHVCSHSAGHIYVLPPFPPDCTDHCLPYMEISHA